MEIKVHNKAVLLKQRDKVIGRNQPFRGTPAHQGLGTGDGGFFQGLLGLKIDHELIPPQGIVHPVFHFLFT